MINQDLSNTGKILFASELFLMIGGEYKMNDQRISIKK